jgi:hypothetical protein
MVFAVALATLFCGSLFVLWASHALPGVRLRDLHKLEVTVSLPLEARAARRLGRCADRLKRQNARLRSEVRQ